jgi:hypothetical protein
MKQLKTSTATTVTRTLNGLTFIEHNFGISQMGDSSSGTTSTTWNADGLAAARGDFLMDMFNLQREHRISLLS